MHCYRNIETWKVSLVEEEPQKEIAIKFSKIKIRWTSRLH